MTDQNQPNKYSYDRFGSKGQRVGQAVVDILSKEQPEYTVEDILEGCGLGADYLELIRDEAEKSKKRFYDKFYILSLIKKGLGEMGISNVLKHSCRSFEKKFSMQEVMLAHPTSDKHMYEVDIKKGEINLIWSLPDYEQCKIIKKSPKLYDPTLAKCVLAYFRNEELKDLG